MNFQYVVNQFARGEYSVHIPIEQVDGVDICVRIIHPGKCEEGCTCKKPVMLFVIDFTNSEDRSLKFPVNNQEEFDIMVAKITCWEFDKFSNQFVDGSEPVADPEFYKCFESSKIKLSYDDCCVCLEKTRGKTKCNHHICLACFTNLKKPKCPLCRADIYECNDIESESDDE
jgi:hypothetical protein